MSGRLLVKCKGLWDGTGAEMVCDGAVLVENGKISAVGSYDALACQLDGSEEIVDYGDKYVMPGIIDAHTHVVIDPDADFTGFVGRDSDTRIVHRGMVNLKKTLDGGVTFAEAELTFVCRKLYEAPFAREGLAEEIEQGIYRDWQPHWMFVGEITAAEDKR